jgi:hypothetical protein
VAADSYEFDGLKGLVGSLSGGLKINVTVPTLTIALDSATADGNLVYKVMGSEAYDLVSTVSPTITNGTVVGTPTASSDRMTYMMTVKPTASGDVGVSIPVGAVTNGTLTNTAAASTTNAKVVLGTANADTLISGVGPEFIFPGAGNDTLQLTATGQSTVAAPDIIAGIAIGDVLDVSGLLKTGAGYTSLKVADAVDKGDGFIELKNLVLTNPTTTTTRVTFDVNLDAATLNGNKITGGVFDFVYKYASVTTSRVTPIGFDDDGDASTSLVPYWENITPNLSANDNKDSLGVATGATPTGKFAAVVTNLNTPIDSTGKAFSVSLTIGEKLDSFNIGIESKAAGGATVLSTNVSGSTVTNEVDVGISKTARLAGASSTSVAANTLELVKDTDTLGTVTDNQFRYLETVNADGKTGTIQFRYDTNSAAGTTTASDIVAVNLISADNLATFFAADHYKVI